MPKDGISFEDGLDASDLSMAVIVARFNEHITSRLYEGCRDELVSHSAREEHIAFRQVPGCFELPLAAKTLASAATFDAIICLGAIIRGDTPHFEYISQATANGIQQVALETGVPVVFGVLTTDNQEQALARVGGAAGHKGREAAMTAIEMARMLRNERSAPAADSR